MPLLLAAVGCAKYNTYYNARHHFENAEHTRNEALKLHQDPPKPAGAQKSEYERAIKKAQKILDEYPGHSLTDDALFLQAKAHFRLESYRQSIRKLNLLFQNFPATPYLEEALYLQGLNYLLIGALDSSQDYLDRLAKNYPESKFQAETRKVSGDNAFAMKDWETAAVSYREYLDLKGEIAERDRVGLKLAECYWELEDYRPAAEVLQDVSQNTSSAELAFRARLLRARVHSRLGDFEIVGQMVDQLREDASIYSADGDVVLIEAEALLAQDKPDAAAPLLQSMPVDWQTPAVKARAAEILGQIFLARGKWDKARENFQTALLNRDALDDEDLVRRLNDNLQDYLAADQALPDAKGNRVARLKLLQANSLLFGFDRPHMAATLYGEAAIDTAADTTVAARAYYGAYLTYDRYLDEPDSAEIFRTALAERFPDSPQAFEARADSDTDLLGYLLAIRSAQQSENFANLSATEKAALRELGDVDTANTRLANRPLPGVRRRMIYFARRDNLVFEPPAGAVELITARQLQLVADRALDATQQAQFDSLQSVSPTGPDGLTVDTGGDPLGLRPPLGPSDSPDSTAQDLRSGAQKVDSEAKTTAEKDQDDPDTKDKDEKKKKQDDDWDFLR